MSPLRLMASLVKGKVSMSEVCGFDGEISSIRTSWWVGERGRSWGKGE